MCTEGPTAKIMALAELPGCVLLGILPLVSEETACLPVEFAVLGDSQREG